MPSYTRRLHILVSEEQFHLLESLAEKNRTSLAELVRHAIETTFQPASSTKQLQALKKLSKFSLLSAESWQRLQKTEARANPKKSATEIVERNSLEK